MLVVVMLGPLATVDMIIAAPALAHDYERLVQRSVLMSSAARALSANNAGMLQILIICQAEHSAPLPALLPSHGPRPRPSATRTSPARSPRVARRRPHGRRGHGGPWPAGWS